jgi:hypothetical protein
MWVLKISQTLKTKVLYQNQIFNFSPQLGKWVYTRVNKWWVFVVDINTHNNIGRY